jgi:hypothetical protein
MGGASINYVKPYIYIIEGDHYKTVRIPEMTVSEPIYFKIIDSTYLKKFTPESCSHHKVNKNL